jgi:hypothetical protein
MFIYNIPLLSFIILLVNGEEYTLEQALMDDTQFKTLSFDGLSFITGNLCADSFIPPGKVADFFGFQYLRDTTADGQGHNTDFLTYLANNVLDILTGEQIAIISEKAKAEVESVSEYAENRYPLMSAFRRQLEGDIPDNNELNQDQVMQYSSDKLYKLDAEISINRAYTFSQIIKSLSDQQITLLNEMKIGGFESWTPMQDFEDTDKFDKRQFDNNEQFTLMMTYISEMFAWFAGNIESDTYFCPERQANYFGSFYVKDAPAINNPGYVIDESKTARGGELFAEILTEEQYEKLWSLVKIQSNDLHNIAETRENIATELRKYLKDGYDDMYDIDVDFIVEESEMYGKYDGSISYYYTMIFTDIKNELTSEQLDQMYILRDLDEQYECPDDKIYKYSTKMDMPTIEDTDFLFVDDDSSDIVLPSCQYILEFEGGTDSSSFVNDLQWLYVDEVMGDDDHYFVAVTWDNYYLYKVDNCPGSIRSWWLIIDDIPENIGNSDKSICDLAIGRCKGKYDQSDIIDCDGNWAFKNSDTNGHSKNANVRILSMGEVCQ